MSVESPWKKRVFRDTWDVPASQMAKSTHNPIRKIVDEMNLTPNPEMEMIALSIGDPTVFGNLPTDPTVIDAVVRATHSYRYNGYAPSIGFEDARAAVAKYESCVEFPITAKDVVFASGCSGALDIAISGLANRGQTVLIPRPGFSLYKTLAESLGIFTKEYNLIPEQSWEIDLDHMESLIDETTACIIVNSPSNPCGSVFSKEHILEIHAVASHYKLPIIADEIYAHFVFPPAVYHSMASLSTEVPVLSCGGLTKRFLIPGWRMGWITIHDRNGVFAKGVRQGLVSLSQRILGPNSLMQGALIDILTKTPEEFFSQTVATIKKHAILAYDALRDVPGLKPVMPEGAMYMMIGIEMANFPEFKSDVDFTENLVTEQSVFCLPATAFHFPTFFRIVLTVPDDKLAMACKRIAHFCHDHFRVMNGTSLAY